MSAAILTAKDSLALEVPADLLRAGQQRNVDYTNRDGEVTCLCVDMLPSQQSRRAQQRTLLMLQHVKGSRTPSASFGPSWRLLQGAQCMEQRVSTCNAQLCDRLGVDVAPAAVCEGRNRDFRKSGAETRFMTSLHLQACM